MTTLKDDFSLAAEIAQLRALLHGLVSDDETEQQAAAARAGDVARVASVLIRAVEVAHDLGHTPDAARDIALAAVIQQSLDQIAYETSPES